MWGLQSFPPEPKAASASTAMALSVNSPHTVSGTPGSRPATVAASMSTVSAVTLASGRTTSMAWRRRRT